MSPGLDWRTLIEERVRNLEIEQQRSLAAISEQYKFVQIALAESKQDRQDLRRLIVRVFWGVLVAQAGIIAYFLDKFGLPGAS